eukprot:120590-Pyramimonas_sp.AAC.1
MGEFPTGGGLTSMPDVIMIQKTRVKTAANASAALGRGARNGWQLSHGLAASAGSGSVENSGGLAIGVQCSLASKPFAREAPRPASQQSERARGQRRVPAGPPRGHGVLRHWNWAVGGERGALG